ncbi:MAG: hypothetical protein AAF805_11130, partial [Planctomycetota bacterium]
LCCGYVDLGDFRQTPRNGESAERPTHRTTGDRPLSTTAQPLETLVAPWAAEGSLDASQPLRDALRDVAGRVAEATLGARPADGEPLDAFATRLWGALEVHLAKRKLRPSSVDDVLRLVATLEAGKLHYGRVRENVVADVVVALGLERCDNAAAAVFQHNYMPIVRYHANRFAGQRGVDTVENLAADLVLPRVNRPPKIATYRGLTPLKAWLRSVVVNRCVGAHRSQRETSLGESHDVETQNTVETSAFATDCEGRLAPAFRTAVGELPAKDRVLLKMLILDEVPQKQLAKSHGVDSGTLTRRRQKAAGRLLESINRIGRSPDAAGPVTECLELLLAGDVADLQSRLATLLAAPFREGGDPNGEEKP